MARVETKGQGFIYWSREWEAKAADPRHIAISWMRSADEPVSYSWLTRRPRPSFHRAGKAVRLRIGDRAIHLGLCHKSESVFREMDTNSEEIRSWH